MPNRNLEHAQKLFGQLVNGEVAGGMVRRTVEQIMKKLGDAHTTKKGFGPDSPPDVAELAPGKTTLEVQAMIDEAVTSTEKRAAVAKASKLVNDMRERGETVYVPEGLGTFEDFKIPPAFRKAGIHTSLFDNDGRPSLEQLEKLVGDAEAVLKQENAAKARQRSGQKI